MNTTQAISEAIGQDSDVMRVRFLTTMTEIDLNKCVSARGHNPNCPRQSELRTALAALAVQLESAEAFAAAGGVLRAVQDSARLVPHPSTNGGAAC
jgi:hypothetical protein